MQLGMTALMTRIATFAEQLDEKTCGEEKKKKMLRVKLKILIAKSIIFYLGSSVFGGRNVPSSIHDSVGKDFQPLVPVDNTAANN